MRKFISFVAAVFMLSTAAFAQTTVNSRTFENVYVTVEGGVLSPLSSNGTWSESLRPTAGIEIGKNITPVVGFSIEALGNFNTTGANTWFDQSNLVGNVKVNLSNWFGGYKGYPRRVEFSLVPGIGWGHNYGYGDYTDAQLQTVLPFGETSYRNFLTYNAYGQVDFNLGKARAWQINVKPGVTWATGSPNVGFYKNNAAACVRVGITYKFGSKRTKSHNFVLCPYSVTQADYDAVIKELNALKNRKPETVEVVKEVPVEKTVEKTVNVVKPGTMIVTFDMGSSTLKAAEYAKLKAYALQVPEGTEVIITGSADSATGSAARNDQLANQRANVVAETLSELGVKVNEVGVEFDTNEVPEASRAAIVIVR